MRPGSATYPRRWPPRRGTPSWCGAGCARSAPAPRPTSCGGWARPSGAVTQALADVGAVEVVARRRRDRLGAARTTSSRRGAGRAVGGAAAGARPDRDGLEGARLLPRPRARAVPLRQQRQRRHHRLVGRPDRRLLGAGRRRGRCGSAAREDVGADGRGRAATPRPSGSPPGWTASGSARVYPSLPMKSAAALSPLPLRRVPREQPEQQAPPVQRLRIRYAKRGRLRFTSHRDFSRAFERAVFRARVPMAYSSGFNPHPRISYAGAAPTGSASEAEYLEIALAEVVDPAGDPRRARRGAARRARRGRGRGVARRVARRPARGQPLADRPARRAAAGRRPRSRRSSPRRASRSSG